METVLYIKNMVCDRCKMAVDKTLRDVGLHPVMVELGVAKIEEVLSAEKREHLRDELEKIGFELMDDKRHRAVEQIKNAIVTLVHYRHDAPAVKLSDYLSAELHSDYSALSKLFSESVGMTIERYYILQRIERVKELLWYDELSLTRIARQMHYSSTAYLSNQFKNVTGMTPSQFKSLGKNTLKELDKI
ncbi:MAG TPA: helix-turn-helix domain-containing protein [Prevotella sp.]